MGLFYDCGNGWVKSSFASKSMGLDGFLCCPGPSLTDVTTGRGRKVFAINTAYPKIKPDIWIGMDKVECYDRGLWGESFMKILRGNYGDMKFQGKAVRHHPNTYFASVAAQDKSMFQLRQHDDKFVWHKHTLGVALHLMIWMGVKRIYFVGCDLGGALDYYDDRKLTPELRAYNRRLYGQQIEFLRKLTAEAKAHGVEFISCTADSPINEYMPYVHVGDAIRRSEEAVSYQDAPIYHAKEVTEMAKRPLRDVQIVGYYTPKYKEEAEGLQRSLEKLGLDGDIQEVPDLGSWQANTRYKASFLRSMLDKYHRILYVDVDARFRSIPTDIVDYNCDISVRFEDFPWITRECLSGTIYMESNERTKRLCEWWINENGNKEDGLEQWNLGTGIDSNVIEGLRFKMLPPEYVFIFDHMKKKYPNTVPVIEHFQASRRLR